MKPKKNALQGSKILIIDDHRNIRFSLRMTLEGEGAIVAEASNLEAANQALFSNLTQLDSTFDLILLDIRLPDGSGLAFLEKLQQHKKANRVIVISGEGTASEAFRATEIGAFDFIEKPFTPERVLVSASRCIEFHRIEDANITLAKARSGYEIIGQHEKIKDLLAVIRKVAPTHGRVLITGESGTGKELIAREIHQNSGRADKPMIKVNCAAIPKNLMESELFGHEKGAFTGALKTRIGVFERADKGTLFLDEIGELDLDLQSKLLRVLQNGEFSRVGGDKTIRSDVRVICATNRDLKKMCQNGEFREDLFYRLNVISIHSPPLRDRASDISELSQRFLVEFCREHALGHKELSEHAIKQLQEYSWPGNVRELRNVIERIAIFSVDSLIEQIDDLSNTLGQTSQLPSLRSNASTQNELTLSFGPQSWEQFQEIAGRQFLIFMLQRSGGNVSEAARALDVERAYLHRLMKKLAIERT